MQSDSGKHTLLEILLLPNVCGSVQREKASLYSSHLHLNEVKQLQSFTLKTVFMKLPQGTFQKLDARASVPTLKDRDEFVTTWH